ncbi:MAG: hypothetical protein B6I31_02590 [Desulfobacteraceae bacterium 4572_19]|nr:MAG: hypothetical protein B6I31_02590 [Desulfobacteraceae bacterium 4572_19]
MSLTSSLYTGTSGLTNMGNAMQVIGDNIANVNTVGYKGGRYTFADLLSQNVATQAGTGQMGRGMALGSVDSRFQQGSFETTGNSTDLSIGGDGFFIVRQEGTERDYYTRAGNFNFDKDGKLVNPTGHILQGWSLDPESGDDLGSVKDIILSSFTSAPQVTDEISVITNLDSDAESKVEVLANAWDGTVIPPEPPIGVNSYQYQTVVKVYDSLGSTHDLTIYYDKKETGSSGAIADITMEEFSGRISSVDTTGSIKPDKVNFTIKNYDVFTVDYNEMSLQYVTNATTGVNFWQFNNPFNKLAPPYDNALLTGDENGVKINFDNDAAKVIDLEIKFDVPVQVNDIITFDLVHPDGINKQDVTQVVYLGDTSDDNTTMQINHPEAITEDADAVDVVWNASAKVPFWSWGDVHTMSNFGNSTTAPAVESTNVVFEVTNMDALADGGPFDLQYNGQGVAPGTWAWGANSPYAVGSPYEEAPPPAIVGDENGVTISLTNAVTGLTTDIVYTFTNPLATNTGVIPAGLGEFDFSTEEEVKPVGKGSDKILTGNYTGAVTDKDSITDIEISNYLALVDTSEIDAFRLEWDNATTTWRIPLVPNPANPFTDPYGPGSPYEQAPPPAITGNGGTVTIPLTNATTGVTTRITYTINPALTADGGFDFYTKPDVYAEAKLVGDKDKVRIDLNPNDEKDPNIDDISFDFIEPISSGPGVANSKISFALEGTVAWTDQKTTKNGYYDFTADFLGADDGASVMNIEYNNGAKNDGTGQFVNASLSSTQYARASSTVYQTANGYGAGDLQGIEVSGDGVMTGLYSNGQLIPLYRVALAKFLNNQGLRKEGGNLFQATRDSGLAITNKPGQNGLGNISPNSLEMSNVDVAEEFVKMITTQRGFQANSKIVTTVDGMLDTVIQMKR